MSNIEFDLTNRKNLKVGMYVRIEEKKTCELKQGLILKVISRSNNERGVKVELTSGEIGYVKKVFTIEEVKLENFKFYNRFLYEKTLYSIYDNEKKEYANIEYMYHTLEYKYRTVFIYSDKEKLQKELNKLNLNNRRYKIQIIKNKQSLSNQFNNIKNELQMINLNGEKYLRFLKFEEIENEIRIKSRMK